MTSEREWFNVMLLFFIGVMVANCLWLGGYVWVLTGHSPFMLVDRWWLDNDDRWLYLREMEMIERRDR